MSGRIEINPGILLGKPVIKGTRLSVEFILELLAEQWTDDQIVETYPQLTYEDIRSALGYVQHPRQGGQEP